MTKTRLLACAGALLVGAGLLGGCVVAQSPEPRPESDQTSTTSVASATSTASVASATSTTSVASTTSTVDSTPLDIASNSLFLYNGDEGGKKLVEDMRTGKVPKSCEALYDQMGSLPIITVTGEDKVTELFELASQIRVFEPSNMIITDCYHFVMFTLQDGTKVRYSFEGAGNLVGSDTNYVVTGDGPLWDRVRELQMIDLDAKEHAITVISDKSLVEKCPTSALTGEIVRLQTVPANKELSVRATGTDVQQIGDGLYQFKMPDQQVAVYVSYA